MSIIKANKIESLSTNAGGISIDNAGMVTFPGNEGAKLPQGTNAQRPAGAGGIMRFNTESSVFEGHDGTNYRSVALQGTDVSFAALTATGVVNFDISQLSSI